MHYLDFENKVSVLSNKIEDLKETSDLDLDISNEINQLQQKHDDLLKDIYKNLTAWEKVKVARHQDRPHTLDYINAIITQFTPLAGDRLFAEDRAIVSGIGRIKGKSVVVIGIEKGNDLDSRIKYNFGMPKPEGYRKAQRLMKLADRLKLPIISFVDTSGAYPGQEAEERGQGEAIAQSIATGLEISTPFVSIIIGEGGSGGAIALATADKVVMLEHSVYSIISPEACASILWRDNAMSSEVAKSLCLTAQDLRKLGIVDHIIPEGLGGAHRNKEEVFNSVCEYINSSIEELMKLSADKRKDNKQKKFLSFGKANW